MDDQPEIVNKHAESEGWMVKIKMSSADELSNLMDKEAYDKFVTSE